MMLKFDDVDVVVVSPKDNGYQDLKTVTNVQIGSTKKLSDLLNQINTPKNYPVEKVSHGTKKVHRPDEDTTLSELMEKLEFNNDEAYNRLTIAVSGEIKNAKGNDSYEYR